MIYRKVYVSEAAIPVAPEAITEILNVSRRNNTRTGLTGLLICHKTRFLQVIEGALEPLEACYDRIVGDSRHARMRLIAKGTAAERAFPYWKMGYADPDELSPTRRSSLFNLMELTHDRSIELGNNERVHRLIGNFLLR